MKEVIEIMIGVNLSGARCRYLFSPHPRLYFQGFNTSAVGDGKGRHAIFAI
jgi:hypothetical protein